MVHSTMPLIKKPCFSHRDAFVENLFYVIQMHTVSSASAHRISSLRCREAESLGAVIDTFVNYLKRNVCQSAVVYSVRNICDHSRGVTIATHFGGTTLHLTFKRCVDLVRVYVKCGKRLELEKCSVYVQASFE